VHDHDLNVYDFSQWIPEHPGTPVALKAGRRDPIRRPAESGLAFFESLGRAVLKIICGVHARSIE
jgi:hypothetical protein